MIDEKLDAICHWSDRDGSTRIVHALCGSVVNMVRYEGKKWWHCSLCQLHAEFIHIRMQQDRSTNGTGKPVKSRYFRKRRL